MEFLDNERRKPDPNMANVLLKKENGQVTEGKVSKQEYQHLTKNKCPHLCSDCDNAYVAKCSKIRHVDKEKIGSYDYITDGYQVYDKNGELGAFIVSKCNNYVLEEKKNDTRKRIPEIIELRKSLKTLYFGTETIEEANIIQYELAQRGFLTTNHAISEREYKILKKKYKSKNYHK